MEHQDPDFYGYRRHASSLESMLELPVSKELPVATEVLVISLLQHESGIF